VRHFQALYRGRASQQDAAVASDFNNVLAVHAWCAHDCEETSSTGWPARTILP
jgi:hypothetical protein